MGEGASLVVEMATGHVRSDGVVTVVVTADDRRTSIPVLSQSSLPAALPRNPTYRASSLVLSRDVAGSTCARAAIQG